MTSRRAVVLLWLGRTAEAIESVTTALATAKSPPIRAYVVVTLQLDAALIQLVTGHPEKAEPLARAGTAGAETDVVKGLASCVLGWSFVETGRVAEGRALLAAGLPAYRAYGASDPRAIAAFDRVLAQAAK